MPDGVTIPAAGGVWGGWPGTRIGLRIGSSNDSNGKDPAGEGNPEHRQVEYGRFHFEGLNTTGRRGKH